MNSKGRPREKDIDGKKLRCFYRRNRAKKITQKVCPATHCPNSLPSPHRSLVQVYNFEGGHFWFLALVADEPLVDLPMHAVSLPTPLSLAMLQHLIRLVRSTSGKHWIRRQ